MLESLDALHIMMIVLCPMSFFLSLPTPSLLNLQEANDSRLFGPVNMTDIVGRVIYCLRTAVDHGPVQNRYELFELIELKKRKKTEY